MKQSSPNRALMIAIGVSVGAIATTAHSQLARPYVPATQCPPKYIPTTVLRGCIPDQSADFQMGVGKHARLLTLPSAGISTVAPRPQAGAGITTASPRKTSN